MTALPSKAEIPLRLFDFSSVPEPVNFRNGRGYQHQWGLEGSRFLMCLNPLPRRW